MKPVVKDWPPAVAESLPARGAWIETPNRQRIIILRASRSPLGGRGLKLPLAAATHSTPQSLPARGAWIETLVQHD